MYTFNLRIGAKRRRGVTGQKNPVFDDYKNIDVTSGGGNILKSPITLETAKSKTLSPLKGETHPVIAYDGLVFNNFELFWQANKVYTELGHLDSDGELTDKFWAWRKKWAGQTKGKRYLQGTRYKDDNDVWKSYKPKFGWYDGKKHTYKQARYVYLRKYCEKVKDLPAMSIMIEMIQNGSGVMILDGDGPRLNLYPEGHFVTWDFLQEKMDDETAPFGHGYVVAAILLAKLQVAKAEDVLRNQNVKKPKINKKIDDIRLESFMDSHYESDGWMVGMYNNIVYIMVDFTDWYDDDDEIIEQFENTVDVKRITSDEMLEEVNNDSEIKSTLKAFEENGFNVNTVFRLSAK